MACAQLNYFLAKYVGDYANNGFTLKRNVSLK